MGKTYRRGHDVRVHSNNYSYVRTIPDGQHFGGACCVSDFHFDRIGAANLRDYHQSGGEITPRVAKKTVFSVAGH